MKRPAAGSPCSSPDCCGPLDRRQFLKVAGGAVTASALGGSLPIVAGPFAAPPAGKEHLVPADKKLSPRWVQALFERGEPEVFRGDELAAIGMPVGGIAAGQLYLQGDGTLGCWQIFNRHHFSGYGATNYAYRTPESPVEQGFAVEVRQGERKALRRLWRQDFPAVEFQGSYPIGRVRYRHPGFPVEIELEAFSPFIPLNARDSALPAALFHLRLRNRSAERVGARVLGWLENAVCLHSAAEVPGRRRTRVAGERGRTLLVHRAEEAPEEERPELRPPVVLADFEGSDYGEWQVEGEAFGTGPARGTLPDQQRVSGFLGRGLVNTYLGGDRPQGTLTSPPFRITRRFLNFLVGGGGHEGKTCIELLVGGKVARAATGRNEERLAWRSWNLTELEQREARIRIADRASGGWGHINVDQIELSDERRQGPTGPVDKLEDHGSMVLALAETGAPAQAAQERLAVLTGLEARPVAGAEEAWPLAERRGGAILTPEVPLEPGGERELTFVLAWHFPNHQRGQAYANWFRDAVEVAHYVLDHHGRLAGETRRWHETYYGSTLPRWLLDRLHSTVSTLATGTCQWWGNGRFWAWEGVGCCHGTCTHVWNYAHAAARLFPELERSVREEQDLGEAFHPDGLVGFRGERNGQYAADGQAGTVLKCYREHRMSVDGSFLERNWPRIRKVLDYSMGRDGNDDGLIEDSQHNTFDINFEGPNTFVGSLYLAALRAGEEMAREVGDLEFAARVRRTFEKGRQLSVERLFDGEYFIQLVDLKKHPRFQYGRGCLSDQVFGQGWAHQLGLGRVYPEAETRRALASVWKYNWAPDVGPYNAAHTPERWFARAGEAGLFTCTWPKSPYLPEGVRYRNEVWTGIEYQVAGHMVWEGMLTEALAIVRAVHERYHPRKHNPFNEVECGDHYARGLASWGVYTALCGYEHHGPRGHLGFAPKLGAEEFRAAFTAAGGWGALSQKREGASQVERIEVRWGKVRLKTLAFELPAERRAATVAVRAGSRSLEAAFRQEGRRLELTLGEEVTLEAGQTFEVEIA